MEKSDTAIFGGRVVPVGKSRDGSADCTGQPDADGGVGGAITAAITARQIEDAGDCPRAKRDVGVHGMERMTEPGAVKDVTNAPAGLPARFEHRRDGSLKSFSQWLEPLLTLHAFDGRLTVLAKSGLRACHRLPPRGECGNSNATEHARISVGTLNIRRVG